MKKSDCFYKPLAMSGEPLALDAYKPGQDVYYYNCFGVWTDGWQVRSIVKDSGPCGVVVNLEATTEETEKYLHDVDRVFKGIQVVNPAYIRRVYRPKTEW